ncbi:ThuA domain-containing protein [Dactylosporangium matsuzakiense]|uniref:Crp/Fnr family transcriptional regulator n=1 Tax=Dactylosporangium matsuzakiense TaxID=53360 RepID=A0A9W6KTT9_9ACTN|nr:ThuA domain-containing protein [Dactylosporangium matsuzakiense]UWZ48428.1 ThuA domain-containing protein [Dactylosporangium matsuzakiense]GLL07102.1 Crp/Fnr family transcriptional regulator [Dactylosporangium matsuzakiense]
MRQRILVYSRTTDFRHDSIPAGVAAVRALGREHGFDVEATEDPAVFADLGPFATVVFLSTSGDIGGDAARAALERHVRGGGGFAGIHAAATTEDGWPFFGSLVGARFDRHPEVQPARLIVEDPAHPSTAHLPAEWDRTDEWYDFRTNPRRTVRVLLRVDEASYNGGGMGTDHPLAWCHDSLGGRSFYTALGHTVESYAEPALRRHLLGGLRWTMRRQV